MIKKEKQVLLAKYRLQEAKESIEEAEYRSLGNQFMAAAAVSYQTIKVAFTNPVNALRYE